MAVGKSSGVSAEPSLCRGSTAGLLCEACSLGASTETETEGSQLDRRWRCTSVCRRVLLLMPLRAHELHNGFRDNPTTHPMCYANAALELAGQSQDTS